MDALAKLKPAFHARGTVTAGNSSQMSDGAASGGGYVASARREIGAKPIARLVAFCDGGRRTRLYGHWTSGCGAQSSQDRWLTLNQMDLIELNEAFAAQALSVVKNWNQSGQS
jgi:acetyl-CoA acyltransferase